RSAAPDDAALWSPLIHVYNESHRYKEAAATAREALARTPQDVAVLNEIGRAYYRLDDLPRAMDTFGQALAIQPDDIQARYFRALCHQRVGQLQEAVNDLEYVRKRDPGFARTRLELGQLYLRLHRTEEGKQLLAEARRAETQTQRHDQASLRLAGKPHDPE